MTNIDFLKLLKEEYLRLKRIETKYEYEKNSSKLTPSEINILKYIEKGYTQSQIAAELFISIRTVKNHISNILKKTKLNSSKEAAIKARELELL
ncbi:response regulator transcription factor [Numidum massiliense]|uniref:response regulator transcription factor n=1 Tax=Numidum massiliense TaxID=1522315 RepID=UPI0006D537AD